MFWRRGYLRGRLWMDFIKKGKSQMYFPIPVSPSAAGFLLSCISANISQFVTLAWRHHSAASCTSDWRVHIIHFNFYPYFFLLRHLFPFIHPSFSIQSFAPFSFLPSPLTFHLIYHFSVLIFLTVFLYFFPLPLLSVCGFVFWFDLMVFGAHGCHWIYKIH